MNIPVNISFSSMFFSEYMSRSRIIGSHGIKVGVEFSQKIFYIIKMIVLFLLITYLMRKITLFYLWILKNPFIPGINPTCSYYMILLMNWKGSVFIPIPNKGNAKECSNYHIIALISHASKVMSKILQARLQQVNFQMLKLVLERQRNQRSNFQHLLDHGESKRVPEKHLFLLYWLYQSLWLCGSQ